MIVKIIEELFGKCLAVFGVYVFGGGGCKQRPGDRGTGLYAKESGTVLMESENGK